MKHILIVEDDPIDLDLTQRAFIKGGLVNPVVVARDGEEALDVILRVESGEEPPGVILLDLKLPKVSGLEVLRQIKSRPQLSLLPIIILATSAEDYDFQEAQQLGSQAYIIKPVDFEKFVEAAAQVNFVLAYLSTRRGHHEDPLR